MRLDRYAIYGDLGSKDAVALAAVMVAKGIACDLVEETSSLSLVLASRSGGETGPYLRTPEGFVLSDLHATLDWLERMYPSPALLPLVPVRRACARVLEDWITLWLPLWPRRSWATLEHLAAHLDRAGFLLGARPTRPDLLLAAWLESEVLVHDHARAHLRRNAPRLVSLGDDLLGAEIGEPGSGHVKSSEHVDSHVDSHVNSHTEPPDSVADVIPISLLPVLAEMAADFHVYLVGNHRALKDGGDRVLLDLGLGRTALPVRPECELRRVAIGRELAGLDSATRVDVRRVLEPVGAWHALTLPAVIEGADPSDPRSL